MFGDLLSAAVSGAWFSSPSSSDGEHPFLLSTATYVGIPLAGAIVVAAAMTTLSRISLARPRKLSKSRTRAMTMGSSRLMVARTAPPNYAPAHDTIITAKLTLDPLPPAERLKAEFAREIVPHLRMHSVPHMPAPLQVDWVATNVDIDKHFHEHEVPNDSGAHALIEHLSNTPIRDMSRPWWEVHLLRVAGHERGYFALRVHHALADGVSLVEAFAPILTDVNGKPLDLSTVFNPKHLQKRQDTTPLPIRIVRGLGFGVSFVIEAIRFASAPFLPGDKPNNRFCRGQWPYAGPRATIEFPTHKLSLIKALKDKAGKGTTVNDVEFALFAGAMRRFIEKHGSPGEADRVVLRSLTPLTMPQKADPETRFNITLRNMFTFAINTFPTRQKTAADRLRAAKDSWARLKKSAAVPATFFVHGLVAHMPLAIQRVITMGLMTRHSIVFSNVPGPQEPTYIAGSRLTDIRVLFPNLYGPYVGILSMDGDVRMAVTMAIPKSGTVDLREALPFYFEAELDDLCKQMDVPRSS